MSGEAEKVIHQELGPAPPSSSSDVGKTLKLADNNSVANGDVDNNETAGRVTPVASAGPVEPLIAALSSTVTAPVADSLAGPETPKGTLTNAATETSDQPKDSSADTAASATIAPADVETNDATTDVETKDAPQKTAEASTPDVVVKSMETVADNVEGDASDNVTVHAPAVTANGNTRTDDIEMTEAPAAPDDVAATEPVNEAPSLGGDKRKADEAFGDSSGELSDTQSNPEANPETNTATNVIGNEVPTKKPGPGRPKKKQRKDRKILTPVGRTARKTRSQGPVEV
ncbi:hypothetical protein QBC40DRAFT_283890 [Triangularia verruculosa]|uniref:Uncharacterized protein n=1 Tax=Triangularia verruculosa TaxID=2587418 RepID=A0AAN6XDN8_9PEZI|nr:hypothetical protein QBC40DRAFT_283890 [Triangularia verruculosa]